jgi:hypothetical protein
MSLRNALNLINAVTITRETISNDGYGNTSTVATTTTVARASIWQPGSNSRLLSDKIAKESTDVLAFEVGDYGILNTDAYATYAGKTYQLTGIPDDVANRGQLMVVGMKRIV